MGADDTHRLTGDAAWKAFKERVAKNNAATHAQAREARIARDAAATTGGAAAARLRASLRACLRSRRSRSAFSRAIFAIVVFLLDLEAMLSALLS